MAAIFGTSNKTKLWRMLLSFFWEKMFKSQKNGWDLKVSFLKTKNNLFGPIKMIVILKEKIILPPQKSHVLRRSLMLIFTVHSIYYLYVKKVWRATKIWAKEKALKGHEPTDFGLGQFWWVFFEWTTEVWMPWISLGILPQNVGIFGHEHLGL